MQTRDLRRPLDRSELDELAAFLASTPGAMPLPEAHGFLTGIASAPTTIRPSEWQPELLGAAAFASRDHADRVLGLVLRFYNQVVTGLNDDPRLAPAMPDGDDAIGQWCAGYLRATRMDEVWGDDEQGKVFLFPFVVLAGEFDLVGEEDDEGKIIEDPTPQLRRCREVLETTVREANAYWTAWRRRAQPVPTAGGAPKVGRNEPCPCGSGRKFKKCCALTAP